MAMWGYTAVFIWRRSPIYNVGRHFHNLRCTPSRLHAPRNPSRWLMTVSSDVLLYLLTPLVRLRLLSWSLHFLPLSVVFTLPLPVVFSFPSPLFALLALPLLPRLFIAAHHIHQPTAREPRHTPLRALHALSVQRVCRVRRDRAERERVQRGVRVRPERQRVAVLALALGRRGERVARRQRRRLGHVAGAGAQRRHGCLRARERRGGREGRGRGVPLQRALALGLAPQEGEEGVRAVPAVEVRLRERRAVGGRRRRGAAQVARGLAAVGCRHDVCDAHGAAGGALCEEDERRVAAAFARGHWERVCGDVDRDVGLVVLPGHEDMPGTDGWAVLT